MHNEKNKFAGRVVDLKRMHAPENKIENTPIKKEKGGFFAFKLFRKKEKMHHVDFLKHYKNLEKKEEFIEQEILKEYINDDADTEEKKQNAMLDFYNFANPVDVDKGLTEEETKQLDASKRKLVLLIQQYEAGFFCEGFHCNETTFIRPTNKITGEETDKFNSVREKAKIKEFLDSSGVTDVLAVTKEEIVEALAAGIKNEEVK